MVLSTPTNDYEHWERNSNNIINNNNGHESDYLLNNSNARHRISVRPHKTHIPIAVRRSVLINASNNNGPSSIPSFNNTNTTTIDRMSKITSLHNTNQFSNQVVINRSKKIGNSHFINTITTSPHVHDTITTQTHTDHKRMYVRIELLVE